MLSRRNFLALASGLLVPAPVEPVRAYSFVGGWNASAIKFVSLGMRGVQLGPPRPGQVVTLRNDGNSSVVVQGTELGALFSSPRGVRSVAVFSSPDGKKWKLEESSVEELG
jgi:hypothetical protein